MTTCEINSNLGTIIEKLEVENADSGGGGGGQNGRRIKTFLSTLINLVQIELGDNTSSMTSLILSYGVSKSTLPKLERISTAVSSALKNSIDSKLYLHLHGYPSLRRLEVSTKNLSLVMGSKGRGSVTNIRELILRSPKVYHRGTLSFIRAFENLSSLTLHSTGYPFRLYFDLLVPFLTISLTSLTLRNRRLNYEDLNQPSAIDHYLPRLVNLEYLYLSYGTCSWNLIDHLSQLPKLKTLGFGQWAILDWTDLDALILGPNRLRSLEKVIFDQVEGKVGWRIWEDSDGLELHPDHNQQLHHIGPGWIVPEGTVGFELGNVAKLIDRIREQGISVEGEIIKALEIWEVWSWEVMACEIANAFRTDDLREVTAAFGEEWVVEIFCLSREQWQSTGKEFGRQLSLLVEY
ncbi:hypothetical protein JCM5350_003709 [Sporobolomyces pararoseus]